MAGCHVRDIMGLRDRASCPQEWPAAAALHVHQTLTCWMGFLLVLLLRSSLWLSAFLAPPAACPGQRPEMAEEQHCWLPLPLQQRQDKGRE